MPGVWHARLVSPANETCSHPTISPKRRQRVTLPYTVLSAFQQFQRDSVDLPSDKVQRARNSRDYLQTQLSLISTLDPSFPNLKEYVASGSFARRTKIRPLDDIDFLMVMPGAGGTECLSPIGDGFTYWVYVHNLNAALARFTSSAAFVDSRSVLDTIKRELQRVPNYRATDVSRSGEAVTLELSSQEWKFDIVPAYAVEPNTHHYLIPDGHGNWKRTDPRIDSNRTTTINQQHGGLILPLIRLLKYWLNKSVKIDLSSYYFETLILDLFAFQAPFASLPLALKWFFDNAQTQVYLDRSDPKGLDRPLTSPDNLLMRHYTAEAMKRASQFASYALMYDNAHEPAQAIYWWRMVFGNDFPQYG